MKKEKLRVSPETFKQLVFDRIMDVQRAIPESAVNAILDTLDRYEIGPIWQEKSKPGEAPSDGARYYSIRTINGTEFAFCMRVSGGFLPLRCSPGKELMIADKDVAAFCAIALPPKFEKRTQ